MRQSIGGSWLIGLMVLFILLFAGYIILTIDYNKSIRVKNEAISLVEKYEGLNEESITLVNNYLMGAGYMTTGKCGEQEGMYGAVNLESNELEETEDNQRYYYCVKKYKGANTSYYYQLTLFYRFSLPVLGDTARFSIKGSTANFQAKDDVKYAKTVDGSTGGVNNNGGAQEVVFTVRFNVNGGSTSIPNQQVVSGYKVSKPNDPIRTDYTFKGWKLGGSYYDFSRSVTGNITLVADWTFNGNTYEPQTCETGFRAYDGSRKWFKITDESGREVNTVLPGRRYIVSFQTYVIGPLSKDSDRVTQQDLNRGYGCQISEIGISSSDNIIRNVNTGSYNSNADIDRNFKVPFTQYDVESVLESSAYIQIPSNYSGKTIRFTGVIKGLSNPIYENLEIRVG